MVYLVDQPSTVLDRVKNSMGVASRTTATAGHLLKHTTHPKNTRTTWPPCSVQIRIEACLSAEYTWGQQSHNKNHTMAMVAFSTLWRSSLFVA